MLEATNLSKSYNGTPALEALNLKVEHGEVFCLLGANGAGTARVAGQDVRAHPLEARRQLAYIPEQVTLYGNFSGLENLAYFSALAGHTNAPSDLRRFLLEAGLPEEALARRVNGYSKGMRQKVGIAIDLAKQARAILMDEPTSGLDPQAANEFSGSVQRLSQQGVAVLMATHDLFRAKEVGTRVGSMKHGWLVNTLATNGITHQDLERIYLENSRE